jgi:hypothetical protein
MRPVLILLFCGLSPALHAATCTSTSGPAQARLIELYTSEGCSSCPPADRWLSALPASSAVVPLAFHVDYWDRLGWRDPYGQAAFSQRQRDRNRGLGWVYTPQVMLDGEDWRAWHRGLPDGQAAAARAHLTLSLTQTPQQIDARADSRFDTSAAKRGAKLYLALYENRLVSRVTAGENAARTLHHDYVVREIAGPFEPGDTLHHFKLRPDWQPARLGVAAFALDANGKPLQALARTGCP